MTTTHDERTRASRPGPSRWLALLVVVVAACGHPSRTDGDVAQGDGSDARGADVASNRDAAPVLDATMPGADGTTPGDVVVPTDTGGSSTPGAPRIFFSDLTSGPNAGGQDDKGVFVTLYGRRFGATRGASTVTVGGGAADHYPVWTDTRITLQLGAAAATGPIVVHVAGATAGDSNGVPFVVRAGAVHFVATTGNDAADGSYATPWRTIPHAVHGWHAGDTVYALNGVAQTALDNYNAALSIESGGATGQPVALLAYPGATVTIGAVTGLDYGARTPETSITAQHIVLAGLVFHGTSTALDMDSQDDWRVVGNEFSCPNGDGATACVTSSSASQIAFLGNDVHDAGAADAGKTYHAVYFSTDSNHIEAGWNEVHDSNGCRGIQFHSSPLGGGSGLNQYDLSVHDNLIHGIRCDGINFATVDPSRGPVVAFDNVMYDVGRGPDPSDGAANYAGVYVYGLTNTGADGTGTVEVYNNTCYHCGTRGGGSAGAFARGDGSPGLFLNLRNNVVVAQASGAYVSGDSTTSLIHGSNNLWFGGAAAPGFTTANVTLDPRLVAPATHDFHLQSGSPALDVGVAAGAAWDFDGVARPQGSGVDLGAYELPVTH